MPRKYKHKTDRRNGSHLPQAPPDKYEPGFILKLDGRTEIARLLRDRYEGIASDLGGMTTLSGIKQSLLERFIYLECILQRIEADIAKAPDVKSASALLGPWIQACNSLLGLGKTLGIERQVKPIDLETYIKAHADGSGGVSDK